jgi:hypothetical protein
MLHLVGSGKSAAVATAKEAAQHTCHMYHDTHLRTEYLADTLLKPPKMVTEIVCIILTLQLISLHQIRVSFF